MTDYAATARRIADDLLFPATIAVDRAGAVPDSHFQALAAAGLYGLVGPVELGGVDLDFLPFCEIAEILVGGCLATAFVWLQHHAPLRSLTRGENPALCEAWVPDLIAGRRRAGVAFAGAVVQPPKLWAKRADGGYLLSGEAPFVSGWHSVDMVLVSARSAEDDRIMISGVVEPHGTDAPSAEQVRLVAAQGSDTVKLTFTDHFVPDTAVAEHTTRERFVADQAYNLRANGTVPLGIAARCVRLLADTGRADLASTLGAQLDATRARMDAALADPPAMPAARAAAIELAYRAAGTALAATGSAGITVANHAQRLVREATFAMVAAGRPEIKAAVLDLLTTSPHFNI